MTVLWWVRHGPTHERSLCGWRDVPADLSDLAALERLRAHLPEAPVVSSDLIRARATADALGRTRRLPDHPGLREFNFGDWDGKTFAEVSSRWPAQSRAYWEGAGDVAPPGGESWNAAAVRVDRAVAELIGPALPELIVVAHMGVILTRLARAGLRVDQALAQPIAPLSVTRLVLKDGLWRIAAVNHNP